MNQQYPYYQNGQNPQTHPYQPYPQPTMGQHYASAQPAFAQQGYAQQGMPQQGVPFQGMHPQPTMQATNAPQAHPAQPQPQPQPTQPAQPAQPQQQPAAPMQQDSTQHHPAQGVALPQLSQSVQPLQAGAVNPVRTSSAADHADVRYSASAKRGGLWRVLFIGALVVLLAALACVGYILFTYWSGQNEYDNIAKDHMKVAEAGDAATLADFNIDWEGLRAINPDVVGWVYVPNTVINYPIVWKQDDDAYYLKRSFGDNSVGTFGAEYGSIFLSGANSNQWIDQINIIYGHHLNNGSMFATFGKLYDNELFNKYRTVYVLTPIGNFRMTSFAVDKVAGSSRDIVIPNFETRQEFDAYLQARIDASLVTPNPPAPPIEKIKQVFAFSTCSQPDNNNRIITFCTVDEFLPAGAKESRGSGLVDEAFVEDVNNMTGERAK